MEGHPPACLQRDIRKSHSADLGGSNILRHFVDFSWDRGADLDLWSVRQPRYCRQPTRCDCECRTGRGYRRVHDQLTRLASQGGTALGVGFLISLGISLWTARSGVSALFDALNIVYGEEEKREFFKYYLATLTFTIGAIAFMLLAIAVVVALPILLNFVPLPEEQTCW